MFPEIITIALRRVRRYSSIDLGGLFGGNSELWTGIAEDGQQSQVQFCVPR